MAFFFTKNKIPAMETEDLTSNWLCAIALGVSEKIEKILFCELRDPLKGQVTTSRVLAKKKNQSRFQIFSIKVVKFLKNGDMCKNI